MQGRQHALIAWLRFVWAGGVLVGITFQFASRSCLKHGNQTRLSQYGHLTGREPWSLAPSADSGVRKTRPHECTMRSVRIWAVFDTRRVAVCGGGGSGERPEERNRKDIIKDSALGE